MTFLSEAPASEGQEKMYEADLGQDGYVWDNTRLWAHQPALQEALAELLVAASTAAGLSLREKAMLVIGQAATIGDSYCSLAWGRWLSEEEGAETAAAALRHDERPFNERERALGNWARKIADDPNGTTPDDVEGLRAVGFTDSQILALTAYAALRLAMSATNDALGSRPDLALADMLDSRVRGAVTWGRAPA